MDKTIIDVTPYRTTKPTLKRVAAYARVSLEKDSMLHSLAQQVSFYSTYIQEHPGWKYCGVFSDEGLTGTKAERPGFQALLTACRAGEIDLVITKSISRFARNTVTLLETVRELKALGVEVYFEEQNIYTLSADGELLLTILASYAQEESRSASDNQKWRVQKSFQNGELLNWRFMLGYEIDKDGIRINPDEAELVRNIFSSFLEGKTMYRIAAQLNDSGVKGPLGGFWRPQQIKSLLSNEKYTGNALLWKHFRNNHIEKKKTVNRGELPQYYAEDTHPAIIDNETFELVQNRLQEIAFKYRRKAEPRLSVFSGVIICGQCGNKYKRIKNHQYHAWNCTIYQTRGKKYCPGLQIREDILYAVASEALGIDKFNDEVFSSRVQSIRADRDHTMTFAFRDGTEKTVPWQKAPRSNSWTTEMRETVGQRVSAQRRKNANGLKSYDNPCKTESEDSTPDRKSS